MRNNTYKFISTSFFLELFVKAAVFSFQSFYTTFTLKTQQKLFSLSALQPSNRDRQGISWRAEQKYKYSILAWVFSVETFSIKAALYAIKNKIRINLNILMSGSFRSKVKELFKNYMFLKVNWMVTGSHEEKVTGIQTMGLLFAGYTFFEIKSLLSLNQEDVQEF